AVFNSFTPGTQASSEVSYSQFLEEVKSGSVKEVEFSDNDRTVTFKRTSGSTEGVTYAPSDPDLVNELIRHDVQIKGSKPEGGPSLLYILLNLLPYIIFIGIFIFFMRQLQSGGAGRGAMSFGRSRAKLQGEDQIKITFADVAGCDEAKEE